jgi:hypothetical protein
MHNHNWTVLVQEAHFAALEKDRSCCSYCHRSHDVCQLFWQERDDVFAALDSPSDDSGNSCLDLPAWKRLVQVRGLSATMMWRDEQMLKLLVSLLGEKDETVQRLVRLAVLHPETAQHVIRRLQRMLVRRGFDPANLPVFYEVAERFQGDGLHFGTQVISERLCGEFLLALHEFLASHTLVVATTGWGKSWLVTYLAQQIIENSRNRLIILDSEGEYWGLVKQLGHEKIWGIHSGDDKDNPLEPPTGVSIEQWVAAWLRSFRELFWCREGMTNMLDAVLRNLYRNLDSARTDHYPTIMDVESHLERMRFRTGTRSAGYHESLFDRIRSLVARLRSVLDCSRGYSYEELSKRSVVYDVSELGPDMRLFMLHLKLLKTLMYKERMASQSEEDASGEVMDVFVVEEAHRSTAQVLEKRPDLGEPLVYDCTRTGRKRNVRFLFVEQVIAGVPYQILGNVSNRIIGRITDGRSLRIMQQVTGWNDDQVDFIRHMPARHWVIQTPSLPDGTFVKVPELI